jgi:hypothetical protein
MGFDQRHAEKIRPLFDEIPDMTIGKAGVVRGAGEFSGLPDLVENSSMTTVVWGLPSLRNRQTVSMSMCNMG